MFVDVIHIGKEIHQLIQHRSAKTCNFLHILVNSILPPQLVEHLQYGNKVGRRCKQHPFVICILPNPRLKPHHGEISPLVWDKHHYEIKLFITNQILITFFGQFRNVTPHRKQMPFGGLRAPGFIPLGIHIIDICAQRHFRINYHTPSVGIIYHHIGAQRTPVLPHDFGTIRVHCGLGNEMTPFLQSRHFKQTLKNHFTPVALHF